MEKTEYRFEEFLSEVEPDYKAFAAKIHEAMLRDGYKVKIESKASGYFVSYSHPKTKRSILNFLFRKKGLFVRIYADNFSKYSDFINDLPEKMEREISKAPNCKRLIDPDDCNPKCIKGYDFFMRDNQYKKCRYACFQLEVNAQSVPAITEFVENEIKERLAV